MNKKVATIILNRNLPKPTDQLYEHLIKYDKDQTDIYVLEAGSEPDNLSQYCTWHARDKEIMKHGLRYSRGMNYALLNLLKEKKWDIQLLKKLSKTMNKASICGLGQAAPNPLQSIINHFEKDVT